MRSDANENYKWDLSQLYPDQAAYEEEIARVENELLPQFEKYQGKLNSADNIKELYKLMQKTVRAVNKIRLYGYNSMSLDFSNSEALGLNEMANSLISQYSKTASFVNPEIMKLSEEDLNEIINDPSMTLYKKGLENLLAQKEHVLSAEEEKILSEIGPLTDSPQQIFASLIYSDMKDAVMVDEDGHEITSSSAEFKEIAKGPDRKLRKKAYEAVTENMASYNNTLAAIYASHIKNDVAYAKARNYESSLLRSLEQDHIPKSIYDNLISTTQNNLKPLHAYYALHKQKFGYEKLYLYDLSVPLVENYEMDIPYDEAVKMVREALQPLGREYIKKFDEAMRNRWVDVYPGENKDTGGYSEDTYDSHPYILLNYDGSLYWASGLAHEIGNAVNMEYSQDTQAYENSEVRVFTTEVAAFVNELILMDYLIENAKTDQEKMYLLESHLTNLENNFFGQVRYSLFEQKAHEMVESNQPLTPQSLNNLWHSILTGFYGEVINLEDSQGFSWSTIPHFYNSFYVYKYATSISAAYTLAEKIQAGDKEARDNYLEFLKAGASDYPIELLKKAGVDMNSPKPITRFIAYYEELVDEMELLQKKMAVI